MPSCRKTQSDRRTARSLHQQIQRPDHRSAQAGPYQLRNFGTCQKPLLDLEQDAAQTDSLRGGLRPVRHPDRLPAAAVPLGKTQCWQIFSTITDIYTPKPDRLRDWISMPKANGYEALHSTVMGPDGVWVEVQIRTQRMEEIAERGFAAHWKYKTPRCRTTRTNSTAGSKRYAMH